MLDFVLNTSTFGEIVKVAAGGKAGKLIKGIAKSFPASPLGS